MLYCCTAAAPPLISCTVLRSCRFACSPMPRSPPSLLLCPHSSLTSHAHHASQTPSKSRWVAMRGRHGPAFLALMVFSQLLLLEAAVSWLNRARAGRSSPLQLLCWDHNNAVTDIGSSANTLVCCADCPWVHTRHHSHFLIWYSLMSFASNQRSLCVLFGAKVPTSMPLDVVKKVKAKMVEVGASSAFLTE